METVGAGEAKGDVLGKEKPEAVGAGAEAEGVKADDESETGKDLLDEKEVSRALLGIASLSNLPLPVQQRIRALRKNQLDIIELEKDYYKELHDLDTKYAKLYGNKFTLVSSYNRSKGQRSRSLTDFCSSSFNSDGSW